MRPALSSELQDDVLHDSKGLVESPGTDSYHLGLVSCDPSQEIQIFKIRKRKTHNPAF